MLKKILGEAPFCVFSDREIRVSPDKDAKITLEFSNDSEYDMPLSCNVSLQSFLKVDKSGFDITLPAEGKTMSQLVFSVSGESKLFGGQSVCEIEISDRIFDSKTVYEMQTLCEMSFKCCEKIPDAFTPCDGVLFSNEGMIFGNKKEIVSLEVLCHEKTQVLLGIASGRVKGFCDSQTISLQDGLNRLCFEFEDDGSIEFLNPVSEERMYLNTLSPKYFI